MCHSPAERQRALPQGDLLWGSAHNYEVVAILKDQKSDRESAHTLDRGFHRGGPAAILHETMQLPTWSVWYLDLKCISRSTLLLYCFIASRTVSVLSIISRLIPCRLNRWSAMSISLKMSWRTNCLRGESSPQGCTGKLSNRKVPVIYPRPAVKRIVCFLSHNMAKQEIKCFLEVNRRLKLEMVHR